MSRTTAIALLLIGVSLFLGSCVPFGIVIYHEAITSSTDSYSLSGPGTSDKVTFHASPGTLARFTVTTDITTRSVQEDQENINNEYLARFEFPISYTISDSSGNVLLNEDTVLAWKDRGPLSKSNENITSTGGTLTASTNLGKFTVPVDGTINMTIEFGPDTTYEASYVSAQLHLHEGMIDNTWYLVSGILMLFAGFILAVVGFIFLVTASAQAGSQQQITGEDTTGAAGPRDKDINQQAMLIQLSALAGYVIPFGSIIAPVILWIVWRDKDPYLNDMGCEAVNFNLSMLVYYLICFVLIFVIIGFLLLISALIFHLTYIIISAVQTSRGADYRYPMIIRFIKSQ